jgi:hypothetical protein
LLCCLPNITNIRNGWGLFSNFVSLKVGDGYRIKFWHDVWCGENALKSSFPELYAIAHEKETLVSNYLDPLEPLFIGI